MFETRLADTEQTIHNLLATVAPQMEPCIFFNGYFFCYTMHSQRLFTTYIFQNAFLLPQHGICPTQHSQIFVNKSIGYITIYLYRVGKEDTTVLNDMTMQ